MYYRAAADPTKSTISVDWRAPAGAIPPHPRQAGLLGGAPATFQINAPGEVAITMRLIQQLALMIMNAAAKLRSPYEEIEYEALYQFLQLVGLVDSFATHPLTAAQGANIIAASYPIRNGLQHSSEDGQFPGFFCAKCLGLTLVYFRVLQPWRGRPNPCALKAALAAMDCELWCGCKSNGRECDTGWVTAKP